MNNKIATGYELVSFYDSNWGELLGSDQDNWDIDDCDWLSPKTIDDLDIDAEVKLNSTGKIIWLSEEKCPLKKLPSPLTLFRKWQKLHPNTCVHIDMPTEHLASLEQFLTLVGGQIIPRGTP